MLSISYVSNDISNISKNTQVNEYFKKAQSQKARKKRPTLTTFNIKYHFFKTKKDKALQAENREKTKS